MLDRSRAGRQPTGQASPPLLAEAGAASHKRKPRRSLLDQSSPVRAGFIPARKGLVAELITQIRSKYLKGIMTEVKVFVRPKVMIYSTGRGPPAVPADC